MNPILSNITQHPKTSIAGLLIGITTVAGVLSQQGITLGKAGTGTVVTLIAALATALLGLLARDPGKGSLPASTGITSTTAKLGVMMLVSILVMGSMVGCSGSQVAQDIVNWTPALQSGVTVIDTTAATLLPADAPIFLAATAGFDAASNELVTQAKAYLANPSATVLAKLQIAVTTFQQSVNAALLQVAGIKNSASQQHALAGIQGVATIVATILGLVQSVSSKSAIAQMSIDSPLKLAAVRRLMNERQMQVVAERYGSTADQFFQLEQQRGF